jgi:hypothetical protein
VAAPPPPEPPAAEGPTQHSNDTQGRFTFSRVWAFARREAIELMHDNVRLAFAIVGPILLMIVFGYGISLDIDHLPFSVLDFNGTQASRAYADSFRGSEYYDEKSPISDYGELDRRLRNGELRFALEIPPGFQRDLIREHRPTVGAHFDAAVPFRAETARSYVENTQDKYETALRNQKASPAPQPVNIDPRTLYNQSFESIYAMVPGDIMLLLILIPSMLTALSVVREEELGSIANFYAAPATKSEFLLGAVALCRRFPCPVRHLGGTGRFLVSRSDQGQRVDTVAWRGDLRTGEHRLRPSHFGFRLHPNGRHFRRGHHHHTARRAIFRHVCPHILAHRGRLVRRQIFPGTYFQLVSVGTFTRPWGSPGRYGRTSRSSG